MPPHRTARPRPWFWRALLPAALALALALAASTAWPQPWRAVEPAPWSKKSLPAKAVPRVYLKQWQKAENRKSCALLAPERLGDGEGAKPRAANFIGGWAVAYDFPDLRSAFGIAGTGIDASAAAYSDWPFVREWSDGGTAHYGLEGGQGPDHLAYLRVPGQACLYNVWTALGQWHLEYLLEQLRFVDAPRGKR